MSERQARQQDASWSEYYALESEGNRIGLVTCRRCGAAVILDKDNATRIHDEWHRRTRAAKGEWK